MAAPRKRKAARKAAAKAASAVATKAPSKAPAKAPAAPVAAAPSRPAKKPAGKTPNKSVVAALSKLLADSYTLYLKTHNFHWNVTGPMFNTLHTLFETQYNELALAVDEVAERIRALGAPAPGSYSQFAQLSDVEEAQGVPPALDMLRQLVTDQALVIGAARKLVTAAERAGDQGTVDLATRRILVHDKNAWMLSTHLE
jgi:starvation-inducible DNA-binding protein